MKKESLFLFTFTLWLAGEILVCTTLDEIAGISIWTWNSLNTYACLFLLLFQIVFFQEYLWKELLLIGGITVILILSAFHSSEKQLAVAWFFILAAKNVKFEDIIQRAYRTLCIMIPLVIVLCSVGWIENRIFYRGSIIRYSLGFTHANELGIWVFQLLACHFYVHRNKIRCRDYIYLFLTILFIYKIPNSQTSYISLLILLGISMLYHILEKWNKRLLRCYENMLITTVILANGLSVLYSVNPITAGSFADKLNLLLAKRLSWSYQAYRIYGVSLWGKYFVIYSGMENISRLTKRLYLDNGYMYLLIRMGLAAYLLVSAAYILRMIFGRKQKDVMLLIIMFVYSLYGLMERGIFLFRLNIFLISFAALLYGNKTTEGIGEGLAITNKVSDKK